MSYDAKSISSMKSDTSWKSFCAIAYVAQEKSGVTDADAPVVLLVLQNQAGGLRFMIHPDLRKMFNGYDLEYLDAMLLDFVDRSKTHPNELFRQISTIGGVGALVVRESGDDIAQCPKAIEMSRAFVDFTGL